MTTPVPSSAVPPAPVRSWSVPGSPSGSTGTGPSADSSGLAGGQSVGDVRLGAAGVAVARGDARAGGPGGPGGPGPARPDPLDDNPLSRLQVTGPGGVLDGGFDLLRFRFWRLVAVAAVIFVPIQLLELVVLVSVGSTAPTSDAGSSFGLASGVQSAGSSGWGVLFLVLRSVALCVLGIAVGHLTAGWMEGRDPSFRGTLRVAVTRAWVAPVVVAVALGAKLLLACLGGLGWFLADALFFIAGIVAGAERLGPFAAIGRSVRLTRAAYGLALVVCIGGFVISQILQLALTLGPLVLLASFQLPEGWLVVVEQLASLVLLVALPLTACIAARAYVELRCRTEGYDLVRRQVDRGLA